MLLLAISTLFSITLSASTGARSQDALGICAIPDNGAYVAEDGAIHCPKGMHLVTPPVRTDAYTVRTADGLPINDPDEYLPDTIMDLHIRVHNRYMKYLGIMMYAVKAGTIPKEGCMDGCDGLIEEKVGSWEIFDDNFKTSTPEVLTHTSAKKKPYHTVARFRTPPEGTGPIIFRVLIKQGATNGGRFYWPMMDGDLQLAEANYNSQPRLWLQGSSVRSCADTCAQENMACDSSADSSIVAHEEVKSSVSCALPLMSGCLTGSPFIEDDTGRCFFNEPSLCGNETAEASNRDVCGRPPSNADGLCPCLVGQAANTSDSTFKPVAFIGGILGLCFCLVALGGGRYYRNGGSVLKLPEVECKATAEGSHVGTVAAVVAPPKRRLPPPPPRV